jgi:hypothetical protein
MSKRPGLPGLFRVRGFIAGLKPQVYIVGMVSHRHRVQSSSGARLRRVVLEDHARLPWRFFGRLTAAIQAGL